MYFLFLAYLIGSFLSQIGAQQDNPLTPEGTLRCSCYVPPNQQCRFPPNYDELENRDFLANRGLSAWGNIYYVADTSKTLYSCDYNPNSRFTCQLFAKCPDVCPSIGYLLFNIFENKAFVTFISFSLSGYQYQDYGFTNYELTLCDGNKYCFQGDCIQKGKGINPDFCQLIDRCNYPPESVEHCRDTFCISVINEDLIKIYNQNEDLVEGPSVKSCENNEEGCAAALNQNGNGFYDGTRALADIRTLKENYDIVRNFSLNCGFSSFNNDNVRFVP